MTMTTAKAAELSAEAIFDKLPPSELFAGPLHTPPEALERAKQVIGEFMPQLVERGNYGRDILARVCTFCTHPGWANTLWAAAQQLVKDKPLLANAKATRREMRDAESAAKTAAKKLAEAIAADDFAKSQVSAAAAKVRRLDDAESRVAAAARNPSLKGLVK